MHAYDGTKDVKFNCLIFVACPTKKLSFEASKVSSQIYYFTYRKACIFGLMASPKKQTRPFNVMCVVGL